MKKIALVGCGRIAEKHIEAIQKHSDRLILTDICDVNSEALEQTVKKTGAKGYNSLTELLKHSDADIVSICTPSGLHPVQVMQVAKAGKHVLTEKPMATRWEDGLNMVTACENAGVHLFVVKQNRRNTTLQSLKKAIDQGRFGRIYMVSVNVFWTRPQDYYDKSSWRGTWEYDGGCLMNQASHYVDLLHWLVGPVASIQAMAGTLARNIEVEDTAVLNIHWRSGALGSMNVTMLTYPKNLEGSITILGEKGTVRVGGVAVNEIQKWEFADSRPEDKEILEANYATASVYGLGHPLYYDNVINVLNGEAEPEVDGREGLKSLELLIAAYRSVRDHKEIGLPLIY